jgi:hypothetical protein
VRSETQVDPDASDLAERLTRALQESRVSTAVGLLASASSATRLHLLRELAGNADVGIPVLRQLAQAHEPHVALAAIQALGTAHVSDAAVALVELAETLPRDLAKASRRELARLRAGGLVTPQRATREAIFVPAVSGVIDKRALWTSFDGSGTQAIIMAFTHVPAGSYQATAFIHEQFGLHRFALTRATRTEIERQWALWTRPARTETSITPVPIDYDFAYHQVQHAVEQARTLDMRIPEDYEQWTEGAPPPGQVDDRNPVYGELDFDAQSGASVLLDGTETLTDERELQGWGFTFDSLKSHALHMHEAALSPVIMGPEVRANRERTIITTAAEELFRETVRAFFTRRLEVAAHVFLHTDREHQARLALASAVALSNIERPLAAQPFVLELVERNLREAMIAEAPSNKEERSLLSQVLQEASSQEEASTVAPE